MNKIEIKFGYFLTVDKFMLSIHFLFKTILICLYGINIYTPFLNNNEKLSQEYQDLLPINNKLNDLNF